MEKKYIVRYIQAPTELSTPALDLWVSEGHVSDTWFDTEEEAAERGKHDPRFKIVGFCMIVIPIYIKTKEDLT